MKCIYLKVYDMPMEFYLIEHGLLVSYDNKLIPFFIPIHVFVISREEATKQIKY